jgi:hypothetical protein
MVESVSLPDKMEKVLVTAGFENGKRPWAKECEWCLEDGKY